MNHLLTYPFVCQINPGDSSFAIEVPTYFCYDSKRAIPKEIFFSKLNIIPDFFNLQAETLQLDCPDEENMTINVPISVDVKYNVLFPPATETNRATFTHGAQHTDYVKAVLDFMATSASLRKAPFMKFSPLFFDWTMVGPEPLDPYSPKHFIKEVLEKKLSTFYGTNPPTVYNVPIFDAVNKSFPGVNPYALPTAITNIYPSDDGLRIRLFLQPKTAVVFSNSGLLLILGFDVKNPTGPIQLKQRQYFIVNESDTEWLVVTGTKRPHYNHLGTEFAAISRVHLIAEPNTQKLRDGNTPETTSINVDMVQKDLFNPSTFLPKLQRAINDLARVTNLNLDLNTTTGKLTLPVPESGGKLRELKIKIPTNILRRMGYQTQGEIDHQTPHTDISASTTTTTTTDAKLTFEQKAKTLVYDTGIIYITVGDSNVSGACHSFAHEFVASLEPKPEGIMTLEKHIAGESDAIQIAEYQMGANHVILRFFLFTILPNGQHIPLNWKSGATIIGIIRSKVSKSN